MKLTWMIQQFNHWLWGIPLLSLILGTGIYFSFRTGFFQIRHARHIFRHTFFALFDHQITKSKNKQSLSQFQAVSTALAATIGTGNIAGVATAITIGGPGAVFWMWVSALLGMMTVFAENILGMLFRKRNVDGCLQGSPMHYLKYGVGGKWGHFLSLSYAFFLMLASLGIGNFIQINTISATLESTFSLPPWVSGLAFLLIGGIVLLGGAKRVGQFTERLVPFMAAIYLFSCLIVLFCNLQCIPGIFSSIFQGAFGKNALLGGASGAMLKSTLSIGFRRGVFSNEAGLGTSVMVHSTTDDPEPVHQGMWGIFEVFFDTIVICSLTAFVILASNVLPSGADGAPLVHLAFKTGFSQFAGILLSIVIVLFAFSTTISWCVYGKTAVCFLFGNHAGMLYQLLYVAALFFGAILDSKLVWSLSDLFNGLMAIPNLIGVVSLSPLILRVFQNYSARVFFHQKIPPLVSVFPQKNS